MPVAVAFGVMPSRVARSDARKPVHEIAGHVRIRVLVDRDRSRRVGAVDEGRTLPNARRSHRVSHLARHVDELLPTLGRHFDTHRPDPSFAYDVLLRVQTTRGQQATDDGAEVIAVVQVRIASLAIDPRTSQPVIILKPVEDQPNADRLLPIWIGHPEATAILLAIEGIETPRPMTHDLLVNSLQSLDAYLERVEITRVEEGTFFAALTLRGEERTRIVDARPSDSIALAVRTGAPIYVAEDVLESSAMTDVVVDEDAEVEEFRRFLETVDPEDFQE